MDGGAHPGDFSSATTYGRLLRNLCLPTLLLSMSPAAHSDTTASTSLSMSQSGSMKRLTCTIVLTGRMSRKNSPCTSATAFQSSIRVKRIRVRMTSSSLAPSCSRAAREISKHRLACAWGRLCRLSFHRVRGARSPQPRRNCRSARRARSLRLARTDCLSRRFFFRPCS
jgi:hypothetical protein